MNILAKLRDQRFVATPEFNFITAGLLLALSLANNAFAAGQVSIDHLVTIEPGPVVVDQTAKLYTSTVVVTNVSTREILSPVRIRISAIDDRRVEVANADGFAGGDPYVEISFGGTLGQFDSVATDVVFEREAGNSTPGSNGNAKNKKGNFPTFGFSTSATGGSGVAPQAPTSFPYALTPDSGSVAVRFSVGVLTDGSEITGVTLRNLDGLVKDTPMTDSGTGGDQVEGDAIYGATVGIQTDGLVAGRCLSFVAVTMDGLDEIVSGAHPLCVTSFSTRVAASNGDPANIITLSDGNIVFADEVLIIFEPGTGEADIVKLADEIKGRVIGTILPLNQYQVKLDKPLSPGGMEQLVSRLKRKSIVADAAANGSVVASAVANDPYFNGPSGFQNALKAIRADDTWDVSATGAGVTVIVIDEGVDSSHFDLDAAGKVVGGATSDDTGHGTQMAGIIAAETDNVDAIAGIARDAQIYSVAVADITSDADFNQSFIDASTIAGDIVNVSLNRASPAGHVPGLCQSINTAIESMTGKVVVNSAGNNGSDGAWWPGRCNSASSDADRVEFFAADPADRVVNKARFIVVSATNCNADPCPGGDTHRATSNAADWVDVAAPGTNVWATDRTPTGMGGNDTIQVSGTSAAAAIVSGAAANLRGCGVGLNQIEGRLQAGSLAAITYSGAAGSGTTPRIDLYEAMNDVNTAPSGLGLSNDTIDELAEPLDTTGGPVLVGSLSIAAPDACDTLTYSVLGTDSGFFQVSGTDLEFQSGVVLDADDKQFYDITLRATDYFGEFVDLAQVVTLNNINEAPALASPPAAFAIDENSPAGTVVGDLSAQFSDEDGDLPSAFNITAGNTGSAFSIDAAGLVTVNSSAPLDFETTTSFTLSVVATDDWTPAGERLQSNTATVSVDLNPVNDNNPVISPASTTVSVAENTAGVLALSATDADLPAQTLTPIAVDAPFSGDNIDGALFQVVGGQLQFIAAPNFEAPLDDGADNNYNVRVAVSDGAGGVGTASYVVQVTNVSEVTFFTDETLFTAALSGATTLAQQDFNSFSHGDNMAGVEFLPGVTATTNLSRIEIFSVSSDPSLFILNRSEVSGGAYYDINIAATYNAIGFNIDAFDPGTPGPGVMEVFFAGGASTSLDIFPTNPTESTPIYFGVIADTPIVRVRWTEGPEIGGSGSEETGLDDFTVANVP